MSSIIFEGNTYTFGGTVSANPGTGTASYVFGGLSSGWTYGFIIWAFNGVGPSSIVGPAIFSTSSLSPEVREPIVMFGWGGLASIDDAISGSTVNMFLNSEDVGGRYWAFTKDPTSNVYTSFTGTTFIDGFTGSYFILKGTTGFRTPNQSLDLENGITYIMSMYINIDYSRPSGIRIYGDSLALNSAYNEQILPASVAGKTGFNINWNYPTGVCGWQRFAVKVVPNQTAGHVIAFISSNMNSSTEFYIAGLQFEVES